MSHNHNHHSHENSSKNILIAFLLNLSFAMFELIGGSLIGSTAILSDAIHDLGDALSLGLSFVFQKFSIKKPSNQYPYGLKRLTVIGALINMFVLSIGVAFVLTEAITKLQYPQPVLAKGMMLMAVIGVVINGVPVLRLRGSNKLLDRTVALHLLEDLLGWIAVLIVGTVIQLTHWYVLDPLLSIGISLFIIRSIVINMKSIIDIILFKTPDANQYELLKELVTKHLPNGSEILTLKIWSLDGDDLVATLCIHVPYVPEKLLVELKQILGKEGVIDSTIEIRT